jgi:hypothetical protein
MSDLNGRIGRNTPIRVSVRTAPVHLRVPDVIGSRARVTSSSALDVTEDLDVAVELALDRLPAQLGATAATPFAPSSSEIIARYNISGSGNRMWRLLIAGNGAPELTWSTTGEDFHSVSATAALPYMSGERFAMRATLDTDDGAGGHELRFYHARSMAGPWELLGAPVTRGGTTTISQTGDANLEIGDISVLGFLRGAGGYYAAALRDGIDGPLLASPDFTAQTVDASSFTDAEGNTWDVLGTAALTDVHRRFTGEVSSWPPRWDTSEADRWVRIEAAGILRRLGQGRTPLQSTLRRRIPSYQPTAYWPMEEGQDATQAASPIEGVAPLTATGLDWAADASLSGSAPLPTIGAPASVSGRVPASAAGEWHVEMLYRLESMPTSGSHQILRVDTTGSTYRRYETSVLSDGVEVIGYTADDVPETLIDIAPPEFAGQWNRLILWGRLVAGQVQVHLAWVTVGQAGFAAEATFAGTVGAVTRVGASFGSQLEGMSIGHLGVFAVADTPAYLMAETGYAGEDALTRLRRLAQEERLNLPVMGLATDAELVGGQRIDTRLNLLRETAAVDGGLLSEMRGFLGLHYLPRALRYNPGPVLQLDYAARHISPPLDPAIDDQGIRNDIEVIRVGGSSARAVLEEGPLSVLDPPAGFGRVDDSVSLNAAEDAQLEPIAWWRLHQRTLDAVRYPVVTLLWTAEQMRDLIPDYLTVDVGSRVTIANPPVDVPPEPIDLIVEGYTEYLDQYEWRTELNCSPAQAWRVGHLAPDDPGDDEPPSHVDTDGSELAAAVDSASTTLSVAAGRHEDFESPNLLLTITPGGDAPWARDDSTAHTGTWSLRSGAITHDQTSDAIVAVPSGSLTLQFWYRVDSEELFDFFRVLVDGVQVLAVSGDTGGWVQSAVIAVAAAATVTFRYVKDDIITAGADAAWIDGLSFTSGPTWSTDPTDVPWDVTVGGERMTVTEVTGADSPQTWTVTRSVNGVVKSHAAGADVRLADPMIVAL